MARLRPWIKRLYSREGFRGPVVTLLSGTALTLVIAYLTVPILTRLFTPAEFGISDYFVVMVSVLITFASFRYEDAIMLPEDDRRAAAVMWLAASLTGATVLLVGIATVWGDEIAAALRVDGVAPWLWLLAPTLLLMRLGKLTEVWLSRQKSFRLITGGEVANKATMVSARIGAGAATNLGAGGLIGGFFAGHVVSAGYYAVVLRRYAGSLLTLRPNWRELRQAASRYRRFPLYSTPAALLNAVVARLPVLLLPIYFSMETVGLFGRAFVALAVPLGLVGTAVSQVFFVHAAEAQRSRRLSVLTETVHSRLVMVGMFPTVLLIAAAPDLFAFVFGADWRPAGTYEQYLAVWFFLGGVASPLSRLFDVLERQRTELLISVATCLALSIALIIGGRSGDVVLTMALVGAAGFVIRTLHIATMLHLAGVGAAAVLKPYGRFFLISVPLVLPVLLVQDVLPLWGIALVSGFLGLCYAAVVLWREQLLPPFE